MRKRKKIPQSYVVVIVLNKLNHCTAATPQRPLQENKYTHAHLQVGRPWCKIENFKTTKKKTTWGRGKGGCCSQWRPLLEEWGGRGAIYLSSLHDSRLSLFQHIPDESDGGFGSSGTDQDVETSNEPSWELLQGLSLTQPLRLTTSSQRSKSPEKQVQAKNRTNKPTNKHFLPGAPGPETNQSEASSGDGGRLSNTAR